MSIARDAGLPTLRASDSLIAARRLVSCCSSTWICEEGAAVGGAGNGVQQRGEEHPVDQLAASALYAILFRN
jgi:hypothetical protein